jgi:hypothetical protein
MTDQTAMDRGTKAEALLLHFTAEAHRRKWNYDRGLDDDGVPIKSEAFNALHQLGEEMRVKLEELRVAPAVTAAVPAPATDRAAVERDRYRAAWRSARERAQAYGEGILRHVADRDFWKRQYNAEHARHVAVVGALVTDRATVLREAADRYEAILASAAAEHSSDPRYYTGVRDVILGLRRLAGEAQQDEAPCCSDPTCACVQVNAAGCCDCAKWDDAPAREALPPMDPVHILGIGADTSAGSGQPDTDEEARQSKETDPVVEPHCDGFPVTCPNRVAVLPAPPHHDGGVRCGCFDDEPTL